MTISDLIAVLILLVVLAAVVLAVLARGRYLRRQAVREAEANRRYWEQRYRRGEEQEAERLRLVAAEREAWDRQLAEWRREDLRQAAQRVVDLRNAVRDLDQGTGGQR
jgi:hypothetical protein